MNMMGHLVDDNLPEARPAAADYNTSSAVDRRPQTFSSCIINGKLNIRRVREFQKRSYEEFSGVVTDLLFTNSLLLPEGGADEQEHDETPTNRRVPAQQTKQRRKEKHVIMFTNPITGERLRLLPRLSLW
jgi:hypothetical protein